jgi:Domain of unknown function (DUF397)
MSISSIRLLTNASRNTVIPATSKRSTSGTGQHGRLVCDFCNLLSWGTACTPIDSLGTRQESDQGRAKLLLLGRNSMGNMANESRIEALSLPDTYIAVWESKNKTGPVLYFSPAEWQGFVHGVKGREFLAQLAGGSGPWPLHASRLRGWTGRTSDAKLQALRPELDETQESVKAKRGARVTAEKQLERPRRSCCRWPTMLALWRIKSGSSGEHSRVVSEKHLDRPTVGGIRSPV